MATMTRRGFLRTAAVAAGGAAAAPQVVPCSVLGAGRPAPSERVTLGIIGCGGMGRNHFTNFRAIPQAQLVAACEVDPARRERTAAEFKMRPCADFREVLARDDIDAVVIATPHHSHAWITVAAARAGKDIYCEKPLTRTIREGRVVCRTVRRYGCVFQVGTQRRAWAGHRRSCELVRNERIGRLRTIRARLHPHMAFPPDPVPPADPVPPGFAWDLWLGPAPWVHFSRRRGYWNKYSAYSAGDVTLMDSHILDIAVWAARPWLKGPVSIRPIRRPQSGLVYRVTFTFAGGVRLICEAPEARDTGDTGLWFEGTEGWVFVHVYANRHRSHPASLLRSPTAPGEVHLHETASNWTDFIRAVRDHGETLCPVDTGHEMTVLCHLIWIAMYLNRDLRWDTEGERFIDDAQADRLLHYAYREPWTL